MMFAVKRAIEDFKNGKCVLIYDWPNREDEVDMVCYAGHVTVEKVYELRTEAGGLICFGTSEDVAQALELPLLSDLLSQHVKLKQLVKKTRYGDVSPFALWVNSVAVRTGISDEDKARTIKDLHHVVSLVARGDVDEGRRQFYENFYVPGHVPILISRGLKSRKGHTELAIALARLAGLLPSVVFAEMLDYGISMSLNKAREYAEKRGLTLVTGEEILSVAEKEGVM